MYEQERGPGIEYTDIHGNESIFRVNSPEIRPTVVNYINNHKVGFYLNLPGMDTEFPMQVEFEFKDKDSYPELENMYNFFAKLNETIDEFTWVRLLITVTEEEAWSYFPDGSGDSHPRQKISINTQEAPAMTPSSVFGSK